MSQYPHPYGYGQYHGPPPPQPYAYQNLPGYPASGHNTPYNPAAAQINRDASQAAYDLNAIHIPGLGVGGTAPSAPPLNLAPGVAAWTQPPAFPTSVPNIPPPQRYGTSSIPQRPPPDLPSGPRNGAPPSSQPPPAATHPIADVEMEEGELSEGQFEDLYEPRDYVPDAPVQSVSKPLPLPIADPSQPASAADTPDGGFYGTDEDDGGKASRGNEVRERSASYSPFLSPREIQSGIPTPQPGANKGAQQGPGQRIADTPKPAAPGLQTTNRTPAATFTGSGAAQGRGSASELKDPLGSFRSLQEAKKEAQKAILRLWPLGVKYQNYIDEGFDEKLIKGLFRDLRLDMPKPTGDSSATQPTVTQPCQDGGPGTTKTGPPSKVQSPQPTSATKDTSAISDQLRKGEERKDRIARLLAAKAAKAPAAPKPPSPAVAAATVAVKPTQSAPETQPQETAPAPSTTAPPKSKAWGEKERLIQQKIAALQKSREAQKSATDTVGAGAVQATNNGTPVPQAKATDSPAPLSIPTGPRAASLSQASASTQPAPSQLRPPIPGITMPPNAQTNTSSQRKRPVASDFVEYSPAPPKRPFGQPRNETSLIIDVSDESDDEEMDMEMDMGSPVDETLPIRSSGGLGQRGPAIRDFPPLTDNFPQRQFSSPAPSITPPGGLVNHKKRTELDMKEKAIQDMRRKIALAEARRKVKQSSGGSVTPSQTGPFSELKENETTRLPPTDSVGSLSSPDRSDRPSPQLTPEPSSAKLPKSSEALRLDPLVRTERRGRLLSLEIPRVESSLTEKLNRLQQLRDEEARLQAEIDRSLAEQKRLADELQQLDTTPPSESPQPNGLGSEDEPSSSFVSHAVEATGDQEETAASVLQPGSTAADTQMEVSSPTPSVSDESRGHGKSTPATDNVEASIAGSANERVITESDEASERSPAPSAAIEPPFPKGDVMPQGPSANASVSSPASQPAENTVPAPSIPEHVETANAEENTPMELDSRSPSPEVADPSSGIDTQTPTQLPDQISRAAQHREALQEIEAEATGEVNVVSSRGPGSLWLTGRQVRDRPAAKSGTTLMPYKSPLRYFHSYRFHPEYQHSVAGGLKSLTYSNRIDPDKELCPFELTGDQCPANCEFQHLGSICPPDDQILLELGNPDDYSGEQKSRFIQGLRELLQKFKADKVKDFDTIARGIIEFRSQLLGDKSKVLRLEGVKL